MCLENVFFAVIVAQNGVLKLRMTDFWHLGELIPRPKTKEGMNQLMRARAMHMMVINTWMNANTELEFCTAFVSQLCQILSGYNCVNVGLKLLESEQMDCRRAGVIQATLWVLMASMATMASMASMAWMDLMAPELKSERESALVWRALVAPTLCIKPFVLLLFRCPLGTVLFMSLHPDATPREKNRSRSLRRMEK